MLGAACSPIRMEQGVVGVGGAVDLEPFDRTLALNVAEF